MPLPTRTSLLPVMGLAVACSVTAQPDDPLAAPELASTLGELMCELRVDCECEQPTFGSSAGCESESAARFDDMFVRAREANLEYDPACAQRTIDTWENQACRTPNQLSVAGELHDPRAPCGIYHGRAQAGDACTIIAGFGSCAQGLACTAGKCTPPNARCLSPLGKPNPNEPLTCALLEALHHVAPDTADGRDCTGRPVPGTANPGDALADWTLEDSEERSVSLHDFCEDAVLLVAAAMWCVNCIAEADDLQRIHEQFGNQGLRVITLVGESVSGEPATPQHAAEWKTTLELEHLVVADPGFAVASRYFSSGASIVLPAAMLLRPDNEVLSNNRGDELDRVTEALP